MVAGVYPENEVRSAGNVRGEILDEFRYVRGACRNQENDVQREVAEVV